LIFNLHHLKHLHFLVKLTLVLVLKLNFLQLSIVFLLQNLDFSVPFLMVLKLSLFDFSYFSLMQFDLLFKF